MEARAGYSISRDYGLYAKDDKVDLGMPLVNFGDNRNREIGRAQGRARKKRLWTA